MNLKETIGNPSSKDLRVFSALQLVFCSVVGYGVLPKQFAGNWLVALLVSSAVVAITGMIRPDKIRWLYTSWMVAVFPIGWSVSHIAMAVVYFLVVTPIGIARRKRSGDPMQRKFMPHANTYWEKQTVDRSPESYFHQF